MGENQSTSTPHDTDVAYVEAVADDIVVAADPEWTTWYDQNGPITYVYATGPCPACRAPAQGYNSTSRQPIEAQGRGAVAEAASPSDAEIEIPVTCSCGSSHGQQGANGCGRSWLVIQGPA